MSGKDRRAERNAWHHMHDRCKNPDYILFHRYGGRGISVDPRWDTFEAFLADMGPRPSPKHSLDRINNDGNYEPGNCRWATRIQQARNKSTTLVVQMGGEAVPLPEAAERTGISARAIRDRLKDGWTGDELFRPLLTPKEIGGRGNAAVTAMQKAMTHCKRGHEFIAENVYMTNQGNRLCKECGRFLNNLRIKSKRRGMGSMTREALEAAHASGAFDDDRRLRR